MSDSIERQIEWQKKNGYRYLLEENCDSCGSSHDWFGCDDGDLQGHCKKKEKAKLVNTAVHTEYICDLWEK